jgi:hypothetical protein
MLPMLTIISSLLAAVFFAVWNPEEVYVGQQIVWP